MQIEVKNLRPFQKIDSLSVPFEADLFINGQHIGFVSSKLGDGSPRVIPLKPTGSQIIQAAEQYCKKQFDDKHTTASTRTIDFKRTLALTLDQMIYAQLEAINQQTADMMKAIRSKFSILYGPPRSNVFGSVQLPQSVAYYLSTPAGKEQLTEIIKTFVLPLMNAKDHILNQNIPATLLQQALASDRQKQGQAKLFIQTPGQRKRKH